MLHLRINCASDKRQSLKKYFSKLKFFYKYNSQLGLCELRGPELPKNKLKEVGDSFDVVRAWHHK